MLVLLAEEIDTSISTLPGEIVQEECLNEENLKSNSEKFEVINLQIAKKCEMIILIICYLLILVCAIITLVFTSFATMDDKY